MRSNFLLRIRIISGLIFIAAIILIAKMYDLQIIKGEKYAMQADRQYSQSASGVFDRGSIFFETKDGIKISAATLKIGFTVAINPKVLKDPKDAYSKINPILPIDSELFFAKANKKDDPYEEIAKRVSKEVADELNALKIGGLVISKERWRFYPAGKIAANVLGYFGYNGNEAAGQYGLERYYESTLKRNSQNLYSNFFAQIFSNIQGTLESKVSIEGDITTTIEPTVQNILETELDELKSMWRSDYSGGIIIDPKNGEIYAMAMNPSFDPNSYQSNKDMSVFKNPLVEGTYEMGSIIKAITMASGLDAGVVVPSSTFKDTGSISLNGYTIRNHGLAPQGAVDMQVVLNQSLNTGVTYVMQKMGKEKFAEYFMNFGLGEKTGIDLPNEASPRISNLESPREIEYANASFGQGVAMTPIATVRALSALANGGTLVTPHIVKNIYYTVGLGKDISFGENKRVIKKETSELITKMLVNVVDEALRDGKVKIPNYSVAAKTGTAQISRPKPEGGGYYDDRYLHSFFGYFPAYEPRFLIFLFTYHPKNVQYASETLTSTFMDLVKFLITYYEIPPDR